MSTASPTWNETTTPTPTNTASRRRGRFSSWRGRIVQPAGNWPNESGPLSLVPWCLGSWSSSPLRATGLVTRRRLARPVLAVLQIAAAFVLRVLRVRAERTAHAVRAGAEHRVRGDAFLDPFFERADR